MIINTVKNTAILNRSYNSRGLIGHRFTSRNLAQQSNGHLWAAVIDNISGRQLNLLRSTDSGFSWHTVFSGSTFSPHTVNWFANATCVGVQIIEKLNRVFLWQLGGQSSLMSFTLRVFTLDGEFVAENESDNLKDIGVLYGVAKFPYNENTIGALYVQGDQMRLLKAGPVNLSGGTTTSGGGYLPVFDGQMSKNGVVDIVALNTSNEIRHFRHTPSIGFGLSNHVANTSNTVSNLTVVRDANDVLMAAWCEDTDTQSSVRFALSHNDGESWQTYSVSKSGHYIDPIRNEANSRVTAMAGIHGFILGYTGVKSGIPRSFVRVITSGGQVKAENEVANASHPNQPVPGLQFFEAPNPSKISLDAPEMVRIAIQVGQGDSLSGSDSRPVRFSQELLAESAFAQQAETINKDEPADNERLVTVSVLPGPSGNVDYYKKGLVGRLTKRHMQAFKRVGTKVRINRYDPLPASEMNDRSAYSAPTEMNEFVIIKPMSYSSPFAATQDDFTTFIERDARKVFIPPNLHIAREFILNEGNFLKRTVWTYYFDGNEYEISQVVPKLIKGQLTHHTANSYVIGPSNDPFSRKTLPSET